MRVCENNEAVIQESLGCISRYKLLRGTVVSEILYWRIWYGYQSNYPILGESGVHLKVEYSRLFKENTSESFFHGFTFERSCFFFGEFSQELI